MKGAVAVIVPVMKRPQNVEPFLKSLREARNENWRTQVYFVGDAGDEAEAEACERNGEPMLICDRGSTFAIKANYGFAASPEEWVFLCGDDVRFSTGWIDKALGDPDMATFEGIVGTNDKLNERVMAGVHATHFFVNRKYVEKQGASWDGPGVLCHEGYSHNYVDTEIVEVAKDRKVWRPCLESIVEHHHPFSGKAPMDEVYKLGSKNAMVDEVRFTERYIKNRKK